ncbi:MAG TPA: 4-hydroxy-3-methylbut-2-enyl diphosphate reductase [Streptosporangiaceae bacterium]|nr:4-hydroxy-3-methylbut-2-enyl diphosphate reductase [Streptosporangiaceae bacterium]
MNRSAVREFQAPDLRVQRGELVVPTQVGDPARGPLPCPAAPLIAGSLQRKGLRCALGPVPRLDDAGSDAGGAAVYLATCGQRDGSTAALAAVAAPDDRLAAAAAMAAVAEWAAVTGTRRLLLAGSPWCGGALRALDAARRMVTDHGAPAGRSVHIYGELTAPPEALADLAAGGAVVVSSLTGLAPGDIVVFPAQGVPPDVAAQAADQGLTVLDATCPLVARAQEDAARRAARGDDLLLVGLASGAAAAGITGRAPGRATVVETAAGTAALRVTDARRVSYLLQPGIPVESATPVTTALRSRFPAARGPHPDGFCYAPSDRAQAIRAVAADSDLMLVLGDPDSADARQASALARDCGARTHVIAAAGDLAPALLSGVTAIGMAESTSAPSALAGQVIAALSGLGPLSVVRRQVSTHITDGQPGAAPPGAGDAEGAGDAGAAGSAAAAAPAAAAGTAAAARTLPGRCGWPRVRPAG